ncbi:MAG: hypothetical protein M1838_000843 [Thelocarpon superellum]|nr:MAG: hypothetical protein M1838_000843 [Thelocarpon superellum]
MATLEAEFADHDDSSSADSGNEATVPMPELEQLSRSMADTITSLFKLSQAIRRSPRRNRRAGAVATSLEPYNPVYDIHYVRDKYAHIRDEWLVERLGTAITQRREFLRYQKNHRAKLSREALSRPQDEAIQPVALAMPLGPNTATPNQVASGLPRSAKSAPITKLSSTEATTFVAEDNPEVERQSVADQSDTSFASSVGDTTERGRPLPPLPPESANQTPFECPLCFTIQVVKGPLAWKKHVYSDLQPYLCISKDCPLQLFSSRQEWSLHDLNNHRKEWRCPSCPQHKSASPHLLEAHFRDRHPEYAAAQFAALVLLGEAPIESVAASACPFCDWETKLRDDNPDLAVGVTVSVTHKQYQKHVGRHLEQVARFALPRAATAEDSSAPGSTTAKTAIVSSAPSGSRAGSRAHPILDLHQHVSAWSNRVDVLPQGAGRLDEKAMFPRDKSSSSDHDGSSSTSTNLLIADVADEEGPRMAFSSPPVDHSPKPPESPAASAANEGTEETGAREPYDQSLQILDWISPLDFTSQETDLLDQRLPGSYDWFLKLERFRDWMNKDGGRLWCTGEPGAGKTMLSTVVADHVRREYPSRDVGIANFLCDPTSRYQSCWDLIASLLKQLLQQYIRQNGRLPERTTEFYQSHVLHATRPSLEEYLAEIDFVISTFTQVFLIVDGVDELPTSEGDEIIRIASNRLALRKANIMLTLRPTARVEDAVGSDTQVALPGDGADLREYVSDALDMRQSLAKLVQERPAFREDILDRLCDASRGV